MSPQREEPRATPAIHARAEGGPLRGLRIVEFASVGPTPFCGMLLADLGADVIRIDRPGTALQAPEAVTGRGKKSIRLDLKTPRARALCLKLLARADALLEGFRPGVMERLRLGPDVVLEGNPKLVFARMTGWGQTGPYAQAAGHDINFLSLTGALHAIGTENQPVPPLNLVGDYGGGALYLALGVLAAVHHARSSGRGQVVDCAMCDGVASLMAPFYELHRQGSWTDRRSANLLDGGAHFYGTFECADGQWISLGAIEPQFYALLREKLGLTDEAFTPQMRKEGWPDLRRQVATIVRQRTRAGWTQLLEGTDVCFAPVLSIEEVPTHPHHLARKTFIEIEGCVQPAPAPRFSVTPAHTTGVPPRIGEHDRTALLAWGLTERDLLELSDGDLT